MRSLKRAKKLAETIRHIDGLVFPNTPAEVQVSFNIIKGWLYKCIAEYKYRPGIRPDLSDDKEYYTVFASQMRWLDKNLSFLVGIPPIEQSVEEYYRSCISSSNYASMPDEEKFLRIAFHEVRHRMQMFRRMELLGPECAGQVRDPMLKKIIEMLDYARPEVKALQNPREFDANAMERYLLYRYKTGDSIEETASILRLGRTDHYDVIN